MFDIHKLKQHIKRVFTPITIMLVPHSKSSPINFKAPFIALFSVCTLCIMGVIYIVSIAVDTFEYYRMKDRMNYYSEQLIEINSSINALKRAEDEFTRLFSMESKEKVLENLDLTDSGAIDMENIKHQIRKTNETVGEIREYLHIQRDIYFATPKGYPVKGRISSPYGRRVHPRSGRRDFHSGIDLSANPGAEVRATAEGIVSFSGWSGGSGNLVVLEHGHGFSTVYAHNRANHVKVGQKVERNEVISYVGSTGNSTGPHVHYEIWKNGKHINPYKYLRGDS